MKKRISILLIVTLLISAFPIPAFAADTTDECVHSWSNVEFIWNDDYSCTASRTCKNCSEVVMQDCDVTKDVTEPATCTAKGECIYYAEVTFDDTIYTNENIVSITNKGHSYSGNKCKNCGVLLLSKPKAKATTYGLEKIKISWDKVNNASGYYIYRATSKDGKYIKIKTSASSSKYYIDTNRTAGKAYYYKVVAYKGNTKSSASSIVSAKAGLTKPVMNASATATSSSIKVSWEKVSNAKGYLIYRKTSSGSWKKIATVSSGSTLSYKDTNANGLYQYSVKAYTKVDGKTIYSSRSNTIKARTLKKPSITITGLDGDLKNKIKWNKVTGATNYEIYYKVGKNGSWKKEATVGNVTSYTTKKVSHGKYYYYKVRAVYKNGNYVTKGSYSDDDSIIHYYYPEVETYMLDETDSNCSFVLVGIRNDGLGKIRIYDRNAMLLDHDFYSFDRYLSLFSIDENDNIEYYDYIDIPAGESAIIGFEVLGGNTWYDELTQINFEMRYDGMYYSCYASSYYGFSYYLL